MCVCAHVKTFAGHNPWNREKKQPFFMLCRLRGVHVLVCIHPLPDAVRGIEKG
jgi:hypothetical protein